MPELSLAGWYVDPFGRYEHRYWDGIKWTEHVASPGHQGIDPPEQASTVASSSAPQTPAAWHSDPYGRYERRYWDGSQWTKHVTSHGEQTVDAALEAVHDGSTIPQMPAGWYPDPSIRNARRYWDGNRWSEDVGAPAGEVDASRRREVGETPEHEKPTPTARPNKKVQRQARKSGVDVGRIGGGTLLTEQVLVVNQKAKLVRSSLEYAVYDQYGHQLGKIQELRRDLKSKATDSLRGRTDSTREHRFQVVDVNSQIMLAVNRPAMGWFASKGKLIVEGPTGAPVGQIVQESFGVGGSIASAAHAGITNLSTIAHVGLGGLKGMVAGTALGGIQGQLDTAVEGLDKVGHARFGLESGGQRLGSIHAQDTKQWDFYVQDQTGTEIARITKTWAGWTKERFTKADNYVVEMHRLLSEPLRSLVIAAALAIDVELKQQGDQTRGSSLWGTRRYK